MRIFLVWVIFSLVNAVIAHGKGRSPLFYFVLSMLISPVFGFLIVFFLPGSQKVLNERGLKSGYLRKCPSCSEIAKRSDQVCPHCRRPLPEIIDVEGSFEKEGKS